MQPEVIAAYIAAAVALFSSCVSFWQFRVNRRDQQDANLNNTLFDSLTWFEGGSQKRSIGIAIIEGYWEQKKRKMIKVWKPLLINQVIHLLKESEHQKSKTEITNLKRIMSLLIQTSLEDAEKEMLKDVIENANTNGNFEGHKGLEIDGKLKNHWLETLK